MNNSAVFCGIAKKLVTFVARGDGFELTAIGLRRDIRLAARGREVKNGFFEFVPKRFDRS